MTYRLVVVVLSVVLAGVSCVPAETSAYRRTPGPTSGGAAASGAAVGIQRDPADLPVLPGEFVQAWDERTSDALRQGLGLDAARC